jgi:hypothetical protein
MEFANAGTPLTEGKWGRVPRYIEERKDSSPGPDPAIVDGQRMTADGGEVGRTGAASNGRNRREGAFL